MFDADKFSVLSSDAEGAVGSRPSYAEGLKGIDEADQPLRPESAQAEKVLASLEAMFLVIAEHGVTEEEEDSARTVLHEIGSTALAAGTIEELLAGFAERLEAEGFSSRMEAVGRALRDDQPMSEETFRLCAAVAAAGSKPVSEENETLNDLMDQLALDDRCADRILGSVVTKLPPAA